MFREQLRQEQRDLKVEMDTVPKSQRKDCYRMRKEQLDSDQQKRVSINKLLYEYLLHKLLCKRYIIFKAHQKQYYLLGDELHC